MTFVKKARCAAVAQIVYHSLAIAEVFACAGRHACTLPDSHVLHSVYFMEEVSFWETRMLNNSMK